MHSYQRLSGLEEILLEETFVLDIEARPGQVGFLVEFVLTPRHPRYTRPRPGEVFCFRRGQLSFKDVSECYWLEQGLRPARDSSGEFDYGNIDSFEWEDNQFVLEGDWGTMRLNAERVRIEID